MAPRRSRRRGRNLGQKKPTNAKFDQRQSDSSDDEYVIEDILDENIDGTVLVKWEGYDEPTWEPVDAIPARLMNRFRRLAKASPTHNSRENQTRKRPCRDDSEAQEVEASKLKKQPSATKNVKRVLSLHSEQAPTVSVHCVVCNEIDVGGRCCVICKKPVHHMCSNEVSQALGVEEFGETCFCSMSCYQASRPATKSTAGTPIQNKTQHTKASQMTSCDGTTVNIVGRRVAFSPAEEEWMPSRLYREIGSLYLVGVVTRSQKKKNGREVPDEFEIRWTISEYQTSAHIHHVSWSKVKEGVANYDALRGTTMIKESWESLCGTTDTMYVEDETWDACEEVDAAYVRFEQPWSVPVDLQEVEKVRGMDFQPDVRFEAPRDLFAHPDGDTETRLKPEWKHLFVHSVTSSFFAFLPLPFWRKVVENSNLYSDGDKQLKLTLEELMKFLGILFYMSTVDKGEFSNYWGDQVENMMYNGSSVGLEGIMSLKRFKQIRKNLCFRYGVTPQDLKRDPVARIRPLINIVKLRGKKYVDLGRNVAVDESSIACRSKYGRHLILYNATKPTGKYHFKIYACCCSTTWLAYNLKLHCASGIEDRLGGNYSESEIQAHELATSTSNSIRKHVLEVTMPIFGSRRIVNTDNYYTSCQLLEALRVKGLYGRGTIRENSKFGPKCFMLSKTDKVQRGECRLGVDLKHGIVGASWADGSVVNIVSNADASTFSTVSRLVGQVKTAFQAPTAIKNYNQAMQGVDRLDQLRARFSLADGHTFKKWHKKLAMAFIDIARCNAYICVKMAGLSANKRDSHRDFIVRLSAELLNGEWMNAIGDKGLLYCDPSSEPSAPPTPSTSSTLLSPTPTTPTPRVECNVMSSKQVFKTVRAKRECVVCRFEERYPTENTVFCFTHNVSLCMNVYEASRVPQWCSVEGIDLGNMTCWAKYHTVYLSQGVFNKKGHIRRSSRLYVARKAARIARTGADGGCSSSEPVGQIVSDLGNSRSIIPFELISEETIFSTHIRSLSF